METEREGKESFIPPSGGETGSPPPGTQNWGHRVVTVIINCFPVVGSSVSHQCGWGPPQPAATPNHGAFTRPVLCACSKEECFPMRLELSLEASSFRCSGPFMPQSPKPSASQDLMGAGQPQTRPHIPLGWSTLGLAGHLRSQPR